MDFSQLETKSGADAGRFMHLRYPAGRDDDGKHLGALIMDGKEPVGVWLRSVESDEVREVIRKNNGKGTKDADLRILESVIVGFERVANGDKPLTAARADIEWFIGLSDDYGRQILEFIQDLGNFLPTAEDA